MRPGRSKPTAVGAATAIVVGLVAVTPAAGFIGPMSALVLGGIAAIPSYYGLQIRARTSLDDSLDVVAAHGVGGTVGALLTGVFAQKALNGVADGALFGNPGQLGIQAVGGPGGHRLQRNDELRPAETRRTRDSAAGRPPRTKARASTKPSTAKRLTGSWAVSRR